MTTITAEAKPNIAFVK